MFQSINIKDLFFDLQHTLNSLNVAIGYNPDLNSFINRKKIRFRFLFKT